MSATSDMRRAILDREGLFAPLSPIERDKLAPKLTTRPFKAGEQIVRQGDAGNSMFLIVQGSLAAMYAAPGRAPVEAGKLEPGECFGEMSLLTGLPRSATVVARSSGLAYELAKADIAPLLKARPKMANELGALLATRQRILDEIAAARPEAAQQDAQKLGKTIAGWIVAGFAIAPGSII